MQTSSQRFLAACNENGDDESNNDDEDGLVTEYLKKRKEFYRATLSLRAFKNRENTKDF